MAWERAKGIPARWAPPEADAQADYFLVAMRWGGIGWLGLWVVCLVIIYVVGSGYLGYYMYYAYQDFLIEWKEFVGVKLYLRSKGVS